MEQDKIYGIKCDVANCVHNRNAKECVAGKIDVCCCGCATPNCAAQTECKTFKARNC